jgi:flagellar basal body rod protein FlgC
MDPATINNTTFTLAAPGGVAVAGTVAYVGTTATFKPTNLLGNSTVYTATITTGAKDSAGNAMAAAKTWSFTTGSVADTIPPKITSVDPADAATNVATNKDITANFSESMDPSTINNTTFTVKELGGALIDGSVSYDGTTATFNSASLLKNSTTYVANITVGVKDLAGNAMSLAKNWSFVTGAAPDTVAPTVTSTDPLFSATDVAPSATISASFSESMNSATITNVSFTVKKQGGALIDGMVTYDSTSKAATFKPAALLVVSTIYEAEIAATVEDQAGNAMESAKTWSFTTADVADLTAPTVTSTRPANNETDVPTNTSVNAVFSENMDSATITNTTFTLSGPSGALVDGTVSYVGTTATFEPSTSLSNSVVYTARINTGVKDLAGNAMAAVKTWSFTTGSAPDAIAPTVTSVDPADAATSVATSKIITANFSENMDPSTLTTTTFMLQELGGALIDGTVSYADTTASFDPTNLLKNSTTYVANITVGVKDLSGNAMTAAKSWSFETGAAPDTLAPTVTSTDPLDEATGVVTSKSIVASFSESMNSATITNVSFTVRKLGAALIDGTVTYDSTTMSAKFKPTSPLANLATYVAEISIAVEDLSGNQMTAAKTWSFETVAPSDSIAPQITEVYPADLAEDIGCKEAITATFDEDMDSNTILQTNPKATFTLTGPGLTEVSGVVTYVNRVAKFIPDNDLPDNTTFTATIATQAKDLAGNELENPKVWTFTTGQSVPVLGRANSFALMATTKIDGTTGSSITGDVGLSPAGLTSMTLSPVEINGNIYSGTDQAIVDAIADLKVAYDTAKGKATNVVTVPTKDLGGKTFFPGLYKTGDTFDITSGNLTLDAQGNENAVFIFQMPETLTVAVSRQIILINNAKASNIYWQVGSSATLNSTVIFKGNILANVSITVNDGCAIEGRMLAGAGTAGSGAVTFNASTIVTPAP